MFVKYLVSHHKADIRRILEDQNADTHFTVNINFVDLFEADGTLGNDLLKYPEKILEECDKSIQAAQNVVMSDMENVILKINVHSRVYGLPVCTELHRNLHPTSQDLGLFLQISGTVVRTTFPKMLEFRRKYICAKCKYAMSVDSDYDQRYIIVPPKKCSNPEGCYGVNLLKSEEPSMLGNCKDYQEIKIQEQLSKLGMGRMPNSMWVTFEDDLVDSCKPGDNITLCGIVKRRWKPQIVGKELDVELVFKANHIQINNDISSVGFVKPDIKENFDNFWKQYENNPLDGRAVILQSMCPEIFGLYIVKLALTVVLAGGSCLDAENRTLSTRSQPHLLLVGDPGTGKSQLLRFASKIIPRSVLTTGIGSTSAGLTVTAVQEDGEWQLEGGALVMADGGICCIDEFNSMKKHDRASIHEAMEQQTISVAKAGVVCKLSTRCTVLAATNPKGGVDFSQPFGMNINIASPLLSRFDVVLHLKDKVNHEWDSLVADHVLNGIIFEQHKPDHTLWNVELLQSYYTVVKQMNPVLTPAASKILRNYYQAQRVIASRDKARTTVRLLDSLIRLSQGHARIMFHQEVQLMDAIVAVVLMEASLQGDASLLAMDFDVTATFPDDPTNSHNELTRIILDKLQLTELLEYDPIWTLTDTLKTDGNISNVSMNISSANNIEPLIGNSVVSNVIDNCVNGSVFEIMKNPPCESSVVTIQRSNRQELLPTVEDLNIFRYLPSTSKSNPPSRFMQQSTNEIGSNGCTFVEKNTHTNSFDCYQNRGFSDTHVNKKDFKNHHTCKIENVSVASSKDRSSVNVLDVDTSISVRNSIDKELSQSNTDYRRTENIDTLNNSTLQQKRSTLRSKIDKYRLRPKMKADDESSSKEMNDLQLLNMIPSVVDEFNIDDSSNICGNNFYKNDSESYPSDGDQIETYQINKTNNEKEHMLRSNNKTNPFESEEDYDYLDFNI